MARPLGQKLTLRFLLHVKRIYRFYQQYEGSSTAKETSEFLNSNEVY